MIESLDDVTEGVTRVRSLVTGTLGTIVKKNYESKGEDRDDSINIAWDNGKFTGGLWLFWTNNIEIIK